MTNRVNTKNAMKLEHSEPGREAWRKRVGNARAEHDEQVKAARRARAARRAAHYGPPTVCPHVLLVWYPVPPHGRYRNPENYGSSRVRCSQVAGHEDAHHADGRRWT